MRTLVPTLSLILGLSPLSAAESPPADERDQAMIVIAGSRTPTAADATITPVAVIGEAERRRYGYPVQPTELLDRLPGSVVTTTGGIGGVTNIRLRGAQTQDTLVRYDGVPYGDPVGTQGQADLAPLNPAAIDRIEVAKGPQSGLYGSRAVGGVIELRPPRPGEAHHGLARVQVGSFGLLDGLAQASGPIGGGLGYAVGVSATRNEGFSATTDDSLGDPENFEEDGFDRLGAYARLEYRPLPALTLYASANLVDAEVEIDNLFPFDPDDDASTNEFELRRYQAGGVWELDDLRIQVDLATTDYDRFALDDGEVTSEFLGEERYASVHAAWAATQFLTLQAGVDWREEEAESSSPFGDPLAAEADHLGVWGRAGLAASWWSLAATLRAEEHSEEGDAVTWRLEGGLQPDEDRLRLFAAVGTAFRTPSLYQLFAPATMFGPIGNQDLEPAESLGFELGQETRVEGVRFRTVFFQTRYQQRIEFITGYENTDERERVEGVENEIDLLGIAGLPLDLHLSYTWQQASDPDGSLAWRLPRHSGHLDLVWHVLETFQLGAFLTAVDRRPAAGAFASRSELPGYARLDAAATWQVHPHAELFLRGGNLTDVDYLEAAHSGGTYATAGINGALGGTLRW